MEKRGYLSLALASLMALGVASILIDEVDKRFDHTEKICPLTKVFGINHQVNAINRNDNNLFNGISAKLVNEYTETFKPTLIFNEDGTVSYVAPNGGTISGDKVILTHSGNFVLISQGNVILPEGTKEGDIIKKTDIKIEDSIPVKALSYSNK